MIEFCQVYLWIIQTGKYFDWMHTFKDLMHRDKKKEISPMTNTHYVVSN